jgi:hypothetical protein
MTFHALANRGDHYIIAKLPPICKHNHLTLLKVKPPNPNIFNGAQIWLIPFSDKRHKYAKNCSCARLDFFKELQN